MKYDTKEVIGKYITETVYKTKQEKLESSKFCNKLFFVSDVEPISLLFSVSNFEYSVCNNFSDILSTQKPGYFVPSTRLFIYFLYCTDIKFFFN